MILNALLYEPKIDLICCIFNAFRLPRKSGFSAERRDHSSIVVLNLELKVDINLLPLLVTEIDGRAACQLQSNKAPTLLRVGNIAEAVDAL
jgi:hypothetical protein